MLSFVSAKNWAGGGAGILSPVFLSLSGYNTILTVVPIPENSCHVEIFFFFFGFITIMVERQVPGRGISWPAWFILWALY